MNAPAITTATLCAAGDAELVEWTLAGREAAFEQIMRRNNRRLYRLARSIVRDEAEAEDALQEGYLSAYLKLGSWRRAAPLSNWLARIVANEALMRLRRRRPEVGLERLEAEGAAIDAPLPDVEDPERAAATRQLRGLLEAAVDALPQEFRSVFVLREIEGLSLRETAAALGIPEATVKTRDFRARRLLKDILGERLAAGFAEAFPFLGARCDRLVARVLERLAARGEP